MISIRRYTAADAPLWDAFVAESRNATFLHQRTYMDYHSARFEDFSLMAFDGKCRLVAVLPANRSGDRVFSHGGLTYGGWLLSRTRGEMAEVLEIFDAMAEFLVANGISGLSYKPVPHIYHKYPCEEDIYALFRFRERFKVTQDVCNVSSTISLDCPLPFDKGALRNAKRVINNTEICFEKSDRWADFWEVLSNVLKTKYSKAPVHTLEEICYLQSQFPENIQLMVATSCSTGELLAGVVVYYTDTTAHAQYIASTERGKELSVLSGLFYWLINQCKEQGFRYFDFGISTEEGGLYLNEGLIRQKSSMGGRATIYTQYDIEF